MLVVFIRLILSLWFHFNSIREKIKKAIEAVNPEAPFFRDFFVKNLPVARVGKSCKLKM